MRGLHASLMACCLSLAVLGGASAAPCPGTRLDILTPPLAATPYAMLELDGKRGPWLLDLGASATTVSSRIWQASSPGEPVRLSGFGALGQPAGPRPYAVAEGGPDRPGLGTPQGTIGTDILSTVTTEFHFESANDPHLVVRDPACDPPDARRDGFVRIAQDGFFGAAPRRHPNVPVVFIELEERAIEIDRPRLAAPRRGGRTWAQLDTGYADTLWPYSVDINEAYLAQLKALAPTLARVGLVSVGGCGREDSLREVYVAPGWRLDVVGDDPAARIPFNGFYFIVKPRRTACGGIGPMDEPAAQLGASFLRAFGTTILVPSRAELWIRTP